jgi:hypothetical protein
MSIYVTVKINEDTLMDLKIGSQHWPQEIDDKKEYIVTDIDDDEWQRALTFNHRFGDGIAICVQKALWAIISNKDIPNNGQSW